MFKTFVVSGKFNRKDIIISSLSLFLYQRKGFVSLCLSFLLVPAWILFFPQYTLVFYSLIILLLVPWLYKIAYLATNIFGNPRLTLKKIEFHSTYVNFFNNNKDFKMSIKIPREILKELKQIKNYAYIVTKYNDHIAMNAKILSEQEMIMIKEYLKNSLLTE